MSWRRSARFEILGTAFWWGAETSTQVEKTFHVALLSVLPGDGELGSQRMIEREAHVPIGDMQVHGGP